VPALRARPNYLAEFGQSFDTESVSGEVLSVAVGGGFGFVGSAYRPAQLAKLTNHRRQPPASGGFDEARMVKRLAGQQRIQGATQ
jgi:hypothetical protein